MICPGVVATESGLCFPVADVAAAWPMGQYDGAYVCVALQCGVLVPVQPPQWVTDHLDADIIERWCETVAEWLVSAALTDRAQ